MARPLPKVITSVATPADSVTAIATIAAAILVPEVGLPAIGLGLATGLINLAKMNSYLQLANNIMLSVNQALELLIKLDQIGIIDLDTDCCSTIKKGLIFTDSEGQEVGLVELLRDRLTALHTNPEQEVSDISLAQIAEEIRQGLYWKDTDGHVYSLAESLGRLLAYGYMHSLPLQ